VDEFFAEEDGDEALDGGHDDLDYEDDFNERDFRVDHLA